MFSVRMEIQVVYEALECYTHFMAAANLLQEVMSAARMSDVASCIAAISAACKCTS
jgi:hypothetical protein